MATYGDRLEPGVITTVESAFSVSTAGFAPSDLGIVGQAALSATGSEGADPNTVYEITRVSEARELFGPEEESLLTRGIIDAFVEDAYPVYAVATEEIEVTDEDLSDLGSNDGTLSETPVAENTDNVTFTFSGNDLTTVRTFRDPSNETPDTDEVYYNPVTGAFEVDSDITVGNTGDSVSYSHFDYDSAIEAMRSGAGETIDFFAAVNENQDVADKVQETCALMDDEYDFALALIGPGDTKIDPSNYDPGYDDSRTQVVYGTRFEDGTSLLAAYAGRRASLGLDRPPIGVSLNTPRRMLPAQAEDLDKGGRSDLIEANVVPLRDRSGGPVIIDDPTTVLEDNALESGIDFGYTRLLMDYITEVTRANERPFIGRLNTPAVRNTFRDLVSGELKALHDSGAVLDYHLNVQAEDATTASLEIYVEAAKPLRFIENDITVGEAV